MTSDVAKHGPRADVLVYHAPELDWDRFWAAPKPQHQLWALHSMESEEAYTVQQAAAPTWQRLDIQANYKLSAVLPGLIHVPVPYLNSGQYRGFTKRRPVMYTKTGLVLWMHNNCDAVSYRQQLVQQLMQLLPVDSPGACLRNMDASGLNSAAPTELMARYKFYLVFENVFGDPDWVSSTFFRALDAGTVPVVLGAPNVLKFAPGPRSIIRACDFNSQQDLAGYLLYLDSNDTAYREYLSWKEAGPSADFRSLMRTADLSPWCEMCIAAAQRTPWAFDGTTQQALAAHQHTKQEFDRLNAQLDRDASMPCRGKTAWWQVQPAEGGAALWTRDDAVHVPPG
ncbi:hypothetical protein COO60DRAFT_85796 [Scenedesmus sp. NREL 46B-D3]|nr:hypothetical protein COO60DRAFT_85796 [Scenedesmus sp. NREL 46B-D3]